VSQEIELIEAIAADLGISGSFIEKDWHAVRLLAVLQNVSDDDFLPVFSGGTSLSKGYGLIQRFSEDLDFKISFPAGQEISRKQRRNYRDKITGHIQASGNEWTVENIKSRNESNFFSCEIRYHSSFEPSPALRPYLKLEMTFGSPALPPELRNLQSFVSQAKKESPEAEKFPCVSPVETAADKLSGLTWRVLARNRADESDDPTIIRHLYDLVSLEKYIAQYEHFTPLLCSLLEKYLSRGKPDQDILAMTPEARVQKALQLLEEDELYAAEFTRFVQGMSYADNPPSYEESLHAVMRIVGKHCFLK